MLVYLAHLVLLAYIAVLSLLLAVPHPQQLLPPGGVGQLLLAAKPLAHFITFAGLGLLITLSYRSNLRLVLLLLAVGYAIGSELVQLLFIQGRLGEWVDLAQDCLGLSIGAVAGIACVWAATRRPATA